LLALGGRGETDERDILLATTCMSARATLRKAGLVCTSERLVRCKLSVTSASACRRRPEPLPTPEKGSARTGRSHFTSVAIKVDQLAQVQHQVAANTQTNPQVLSLSLLLPQTKQKERKQTTFRPCQRLVAGRVLKLRVEKQQLTLELKYFRPQQQRGG